VPSYRRVLVCGHPMADRPDPGSGDTARGTSRRIVAGWKS